VLHQLIRAYQTEGDAGASKVLAAVASKAETSRQLAYRLYTLCERKGMGRRCPSVQRGRDRLELDRDRRGEDSRAEPGHPV
jgi:hypothetical protein